MSVTMQVDQSQINFTVPPFLAPAHPLKQVYNYQNIILIHLQKYIQKVFNILKPMLAVGPLESQQNSSSYSTLFYLQAKVRYLIDAIKISDKFKWQDVQNLSDTTKQTLQTLIKQKGEGYIQKNIRQLKCREDDKLMICASLLEKIYLMLSEDTELELKMNSIDSRINEQIVYEQARNKKVEKNPCLEIQAYLLLYLAILMTTKNKNCAQTYLKLWSQRAKSSHTRSVNQFCGFIGNMNYVFLQWKDNVEFLQKYLQTVNSLMEKTLKTNPQAAGQQTMVGIQKNVAKLQQIVRKKKYSFIRNDITNQFNEKAQFLTQENSREELLDTLPISMLSRGQETIQSFYFYLLILMSTQQPYLLYKIQQKLFNKKQACGPFKETDFDIQDLILTCKIVGRVVQLKNTSLSNFKPIIQIQVIKIGDHQPSTAFKASHRPEEEPQKQQGECLYTILDPVLKTCGILEQKFFLFFGLSHPDSSNLSQQLLKEVENLVYFQKVEEASKLIICVKQILKFHPQADIYIFNISNQIEIQQFQFVLNDEFQAVIHIYAIKQTIQKYLNKIKYSTIKQWSDLPQEIKKMKILQTHSKMFLNYTVATGREKSMINKFQFNMKWMKQSCVKKQDRAKAKMDFYIFVDQWLNWSTFQRGKDVDQVFKLINQYDKNFDDLEKGSRILVNLYTRQNFFHVILNKSLRGFTNPKHVGFLRYIFSGFYQAIQFSSKEQTALKSKLICYRGVALNKKRCEALLNQFEDLKQEYIQMQGFVSASKSLQIAESFGKTPIIQISIQPHAKSSQASGFFFINYSQFQQEQQILFNSRNYYKIKAVDKQKKIVKLEYCHMEVPEFYKKDEQYLNKFKQMLDYHNFINDIKIQTQQDAFISQGNYSTAISCFEQQILEHAFYSLRKFQFTEETVPSKLEELEKELNLSTVLRKCIQNQWEIFCCRQNFMKKKTKNSCTNMENLFYLLMFHLIKTEIQNYTGYFFSAALKMSSMKLVKRAYLYSQIAKHIIQVKCKIYESNFQIELAHYFKHLLGSLNILIATIVFYICSYEEMQRCLTCQATKFYRGRVKDTLDEAKIFRCLAICYMAKRQHKNTFSLSQSYFIKCLQILKKIGMQVSFEYIQTNYNLANIYLNYGLYEKVSQPLQEAIKICYYSFGAHHIHHLLNLKCKILFNFIVGDFWELRINLEKISAKNQEVLKYNVPFTQNNCSLFLGQTTILIAKSQFRQAQLILQKILPLVSNLFSKQYILYKVFLAFLYYCKFMLNKNEEFENLKIQLNCLKSQDFQLNIQILSLNLLISYASSSYKTMKDLATQMIDLMRSYHHEKNFQFSLAHAYLGFSLANLGIQDKQKIIQTFSICDQYFKNPIMANSPYRYKSLIIMAEGYLRCGQIKLALDILIQAQQLLKQSGFQNTYQHYRMYKTYQQVLIIQKRKTQCQQVRQISSKIQKQIFGNQTTASILQNNPTMEINVAEIFIQKNKLIAEQGD